MMYLFVYEGHGPSDLYMEGGGGCDAAHRCQGRGQRKRLFPWIIPVDRKRGRIIVISGYT